MLETVSFTSGNQGVLGSTFIINVGKTSTVKKYQDFKDVFANYHLVRGYRGVFTRGNSPVFQKARTTRGVRDLLKFTLQHG